MSKKSTRSDKNGETWVIRAKRKIKKYCAIKGPKTPQNFPQTIKRLPKIKKFTKVLQKLRSTLQSPSNESQDPTNGSSRSKSTPEHSKPPQIIPYDIQKKLNPPPNILKNTPKYLKRPKRDP